MQLLQDIERPSRMAIALACIAIVLAVGTVDYLTGFEIGMSVFYLLAVGLATWRLGRRFGVLIACLSVATGLLADYAAGARYRNSFVPIWNAAILLVFYSVVIWLLARLRALQTDLNHKVRERTLALTQEMAERERLEKEILGVTEREQVRIGQDIHDILCQHLTATALAGQVLVEKLAQKSATENSDARHIVALIESSITMARNLARGVQPVQVDAEGLMDAFRNLATATSQTARVECSFECDAPVLVEDAATATNLYRIGLEAVNNAVRHGRPARISVTLACQSNGLTLTVEDDGVGLAENWDKGDGLGSRIMAHRAAMIGGRLTIEPNPIGGTMVACSLPLPS